MYCHWFDPKGLGPTIYHTQKTEQMATTLYWRIKKNFYITCIYILNVHASNNYYWVNESSEFTRTCLVHMLKGVDWTIEHQTLHIVSILQNQFRRISENGWLLCLAERWMATEKTSVTIKWLCLFDLMPVKCLCWVLTVWWFLMIKKKKKTFHTAEFLQKICNRVIIFANIYCLVPLLTIWMV